MEQDRYKKNHFSYIAGMLSLITSLVLFACSLFLIPNLIFGWHYALPGFLIELMAMLENDYGMTPSSINWLLCGVLVIPGVVLFIMADILSNKIDNEIYEVNRFVPEAQTKKKDGNSGLEESGGLFFRMTMIVIVVFLVAGVFQWLL